MLGAPALTCKVGGLGLIPKFMAEFRAPGGIDSKIQMVRLSFGLHCAQVLRNIKWCLVRLR